MAFYLPQFHPNPENDEWWGKDLENGLYINAWNEWGEGAILEPALRYGYKSLSIVKQCLESIREK